MVQNGRISDFRGLLTLTLTLDPGMVITFFHISSSTTCIPNFIEIEETFCGRTDTRTDGRKFATCSIRSTSKFGSRPKMDTPVCLAAKVENYDFFHNHVLEIALHDWGTMAVHSIRVKEVYFQNVIQRTFCIHGHGHLSLARKWCQFENTNSWTVFRRQ